MSVIFAKLFIKTEMDSELMILDNVTAWARGVRPFRSGTYRDTGWAAGKVNPVASSNGSVLSTASDVPIVGTSNAPVPDKGYGALVHTAPDEMLHVPPRLRKSRESGYLFAFGGATIQQAVVDTPETPRLALAAITVNTTSNVCAAVRTVVVSLPCDTTDGSTTVTASSTSSLAVGMSVSGLGIPSGATIATIVNATHFTLSAAATATATGSYLSITGTVSATHAFVTGDVVAIYAATMPGVSGVTLTAATSLMSVVKIDDGSFLLRKADGTIADFTASGSNVSVVLVSSVLPPVEPPMPANETGVIFIPDAWNPRISTSDPRL